MFQDSEVVTSTSSMRKPELKDMTNWATFKPPWGPIGERVYLRSYSQTKNRAEIAADIHAGINGTKEDKETYFETVTRAVQGNLAFVGPEFLEPLEEEKLTALLMQQEGIPAGRHLYSTGLKGRQFVNNCHAAGWDKDRPWLHFSFLFDQLMQGGGVGSNYSNRYLAEMPKFKRKVDLKLVCDPSHPDIPEFQHLLSDFHGERKAFIRVEDSREGWVDAAEVLLKHAWGFNGEQDEFTVDLTPVRRKGVPLVTSGGVAAGPGPLAILLFEMVRVINRCFETQTFASLDAMDIDHSIAACVVAGGKRRSSRMSVKNWQDPDIFEFLKCKGVDGKHWSTNISVETDSVYEMACHKGFQHAVDVALSVAAGMIKNGEPGTWNRSLSQKGEREPELMFCPNPCGEICMQMWENCCLGHVNMQFFANRPLHKMVEAFRLMTRWLIRATFGDVTHECQRKVMDKNRRIGVGFFGFHGWLALQGIKYSECYQNDYVVNVLSKCREAVNNEASKFAKALGIEQPVKTTAIAPTGTISLLPGVTSGVQPLYARRFKRRVRYADTDSELQSLKAAGYPVEKALNELNTEVVTYYCEDPLLAKVRSLGYGDDIIESQDEISLHDYLSVQRMLQMHFSNNAISFTINLPIDDMPDATTLAGALLSFHSDVKGTTLFPDMSRAQSPIERLSDEQWASWEGSKEVTQFEEDCKGGCPVR